MDLHRIFEPRYFVAKFNNMTSDKLKSIAQQLLDLAKTIDEKPIGGTAEHTQLYDVICVVGATKYRLELLLEMLNFANGK